MPKRTTHRAEVVDGRAGDGGRERGARAGQRADEERAAERVARHHRQEQRQLGRALPLVAHTHRPLLLPQPGFMAADSRVCVLGRAGLAGFTCGHGVIDVVVRADFLGV